MDPLDTSGLDEGMAALEQQTARLRDLVEQERAAAAHQLAALEEERSRTAERLAKVKDEALRLAEQLARIDAEQAAARAATAQLEAEKAAALARAEQLEREASAAEVRIARLEEEKAGALTRSARLEDEKGAALVRVAELEEELVTLRAWSVSLPPAMKPMAVALHQAVARALAVFDAAAATAGRGPGAADHATAFSRRWGAALRKIWYLLDIAYYTLAADDAGAAAGLAPARDALARARRRVAELARAPGAAPTPAALQSWAPPAPELDPAVALTTGSAGEPLLQLSVLAQQIDAAMNGALAAARTEETLTPDQEEVIRLVADLWVDLYRPRPVGPLADVRSALAGLLAPAGFRAVEPQVRGLLRPGYELHGSLVCPPEVSGGKER